MIVIPSPLGCEVLHLVNRVEQILRKPFVANRAVESFYISMLRWIYRLAAVDPHPGIYLRQVDVPGVPSKFIETARGVLGELFELCLPADAINPKRIGSSQFCARFGFLEKPLRLRFRILDDQLKIVSRMHHAAHSAALAVGHSIDITLDAASFAVLDALIRRVFITENETNFLAFPGQSASIVLFGAGYGWEALASAAWLQDCQLSYWGDIDTHGFAILDQLRSRFAHVESLLMDRATLMAHQPHWSHEAKQVAHALPRLNADESALFDDLRHNRIQQGLRLEQERVGWHWLQSSL